MLIQVIVTADKAADIRSLLRTALDAGASWVEIKVADSVSDADISEIAKEFRPELAEKNCVLILADRFDLVKEIEADGVHMYSRATPLSAVRTRLDAWPIIGVNVESTDELDSLRGHDIDYLFFPLPDSRQTLSEIAQALQKADSETPLVAGAGVTPDNAWTLAEAGASALAVDASMPGLADFIAKMK